MRGGNGLWAAAIAGCLGCGQLSQAIPEDTPADESGGESSDGGETSEGSSSGAVADDDGTSSDGTTGSGAEPGDADTDTSDGSESDGSSGDAEPTSCWGTDPTVWEVEELDVSQLVGGQVNEVALSGDGLSLVYVAVDDAGRTGYIVERDAKSDPFVGGQALAPWATNMPDTGSFRFAAGWDRLSLLHDGEVQTSDRNGGDWETPVTIEFKNAITELVGPPHFFDDALAVMLDVGDGALDDDGNPTLVAYEARRKDTASQMGERTRITMPQWSDDTPLICALPSPDGQRVIFGGAFPAVWSDPDEMLTSALDVWISERVDDQTWAEPIEIDAVSHDDLLSCPTSITDDGCLLTVRHFELGVGTAEFSLARR